MSFDDPVQAAQLAVALCKEEVEAVIGHETLHQLDEGSPWSRAFLRACKIILDEPEPAPEVKS